MDITNRDVREITMSKYFTKKSISYWIIAVLVILIAIILAVQFKANSNSQTTTSTVKTSSSSEKASSSTKKYVEGKDYKITYSNKNLIDKAALDKALKNSTGSDISYMMDTSEDGGDMAKVEVYYNKDKNLLVERLFKNGYKDNQPTQTVGYDLQKQAMNLDKTFGNDYLNQPLVYTWEKLSK